MDKNAGARGNGKRARQPTTEGGEKQLPQGRGSYKPGRGCCLLDFCRLLWEDLVDPRCEAATSTDREMVQSLTVEGPADGEGDPPKGADGHGRKRPKPLHQGSHFCIVSFSTTMCYNTVENDDFAIEYRPSTTIPRGVDFVIVPYNEQWKPAIVNFAGMDVGQASALLAEHCTEEGIRLRFQCEPFLFILKDDGYGPGQGKGSPVSFEVICCEAVSFIPHQTVPVAAEGCGVDDETAQGLGEVTMLIKMTRGATDRVLVMALRERNNNDRNLVYVSPIMRPIAAPAGIGTKD